jgi:hypothetical protein
VDPEDYRRSREAQRARRGSRGGAGQYGGSAGPSHTYEPRGETKPKAKTGHTVRKVRGRWQQVCLYCTHYDCKSCLCCSLFRDEQPW